MTMTPQGQEIYTGRADEDVLIARWWGRMAVDGDLDQLFTADSRTLRCLFGIVGPPHAFVYQADAEGIWFAMWTEQVLTGAFTGMWLRRDRRRTRRGLYAFLDALSWFLTFHPVLLGVTKQQKIIKEHLALGYTRMGDPLPDFFDGEPGYAVMLTRAAFGKTLERFKRPPIGGG